ncbi:hypothetical protein F4777DRAFT_219399 [Nemania sp. FL0916]|nr:hypothetical protein F4777DRAFT_219399 [Nemania sp. FL0916]
MRKGKFPLSDLPAWCMLHSITFAGVEVASIEDRGLGLIAEKRLSNENGESPALLTIPRELVLSAAKIEEYAKESKDFCELLAAAGHQSLRRDALLFLLAQLILSSPDHDGGLGGSTAWTHYFKLLPTQVPVPTLWSASELSLLRGTSLEPAVIAKHSALEREFDHIRDVTADLPRWNRLIGTGAAITLDDWVLLDALYRSRSLALPTSGESMVPCLDLVNHSNPATAYFEENTQDEVVLLLRDGANLLEKHEVTIDYGHDKSPAEMLFSYGFVDPTSPARRIVLPLESMDDDPLAKAKLYVFGSAPTLKILDSETGVPEWDAPFVHLMCLNDEDGLNFQILQETDGSQHLRMFWQGLDVTEKAEDMETLIKRHELCQVFRLRAVTVVSGMIQRQLQALAAYDRNSGLAGDERPHIVQAASLLRDAEKDLFERTFQLLDNEKLQLLADESVKAYLSAVTSDAQQESIEDNDFS